MWQIRFYEDRRGKSPVLDYLNKLQTPERAKAYNALRLLQEFGPDINMPHAKRIEGRLWELRPGANRLFYFLLVDQTFVILHGFRKQSQKTPELEIHVALSRMQELLEDMR